MNIGLNVPDHTTLSQRNSTLKPKLKRVGKPRGRVDLVIDSTGLVIHGEGRWTRHKHGKRKRRGWRKLHIGVSNGFIVAHYLSEDSSRSLFQDSMTSSESHKVRSPRLIKDRS